MFGMATTTKSPKAKTKTAKAKSTKSSSTKTSSKSTTKKVTKPAAKAEVKVSASTGPSKTSLLQKIYMASIAINVAIVGAAYMLMNKTSYQLSVGFWTRDDLASKTSTVFAPATQGIVDIQIRYIVMAIAAVSLVLPILYLTRLEAFHAKAMKNKVLPTRWIEMAITTALMVETVAILSGVLDIAVLKVVGGLMAVTMVLGWMAEKRTAEAGRPATAKYYLSMVTGLLPWILIATYAVSTYVFGGIRSPWYVYALYAVMLIGAGVIGSYQLKGLKSEGELKNYDLVERNYAVLSLLVRTVFAVVLIVGLMAK